MNVCVVMYDEPGYQATLIGAFINKTQAILSVEKLLSVQDDDDYKMRYFKFSEVEMGKNLKLLK